MINVVAGVCLRGELIFMSQRCLEEKSYPGCWSFPGGKIEQGESPRDALIREFAEEVGLVITPAYEPYAVFVMGNYRFHCFVVRMQRAEPAMCLDATIGVGWFTPKAINHLGTTPMVCKALRSLP